MKKKRRAADMRDRCFVAVPAFDMDDLAEPFSCGLMKKGFARYYATSTY
jgi:hypothetical protein